MVNKDKVNTTSKSDDNVKQLPPFLSKLMTVTKTVPNSIADWADDGLSYWVKDNDKFEIELKQHYKGSLQTFIRQLHFYGFRKVDTSNNSGISPAAAEENGSKGWSFVHKHFRKDKPELIFEIKRKTRNETGVNGMATQLEVEELRSQVASLKNVVEELRLQLCNLATKQDNKDNENVSLSSIEEKENNRRNYNNNKRLKRSSSNDKSLIKMETNNDDHDFASKSSMEPDEFFLACTQSPKIDTIDPYPIDMMQDNIIDGFDDGLLYKLTNNEEEKYPENITALSNRIYSNNNNTITKEDTAKVVADATELDSKSVQKVLAFFEKAIKKSEKSVPSNHSSYSKIQSAIQKYREESIIPTQEVGAN